jgi:hypothetical protein
MITPLSEALRTRPFSVMVELVASGLKREAQVLEIASNLATIPDVVAGSITSYAGGRFGQDSVRVGTAVRRAGSRRTSTSRASTRIASRSGRRCTRCARSGCTTCSR